jgi:hypothetical protein
MGTERAERARVLVEELREIARDEPDLVMDLVMNAVKPETDAERAEYVRSAPKARALMSAIQSALFKAMRFKRPWNGFVGVPGSRSKRWLVFVMSSHRDDMPEATGNTSN